MCQRAPRRTPCLAHASASSKACMHAFEQTFRHARELKPTVPQNRPHPAIFRLSFTLLHTRCLRDARLRAARMCAPPGSACAAMQRWPVHVRPVAGHDRASREVSRQTSPEVRASLQQMCHKRVHDRLFRKASRRGSIDHVDMHVDMRTYACPPR